MVEVVQKSNSYPSYTPVVAAAGAVAGGLTGFMRKPYLENGALSDVFVSSVKQIMPQEGKDLLETQVQMQIGDKLKSANRYYGARFNSGGELTEFLNNICEFSTERGTFDRIKETIMAHAQKCSENRFFNKITPQEKAIAGSIGNASTIEEVITIIQGLEPKVAKKLGKRLGREFSIFLNTTPEAAQQKISDIGKSNFMKFLGNEFDYIESLFRGASSLTPSEQAMKESLNRISQTRNPQEYVALLIRDYAAIEDNLRSNIITSAYNPTTKEFVGQADGIMGYVKNCATKTRAKAALWGAIFGAAILSIGAYLYNDWRHSPSNIPMKKN